MTGMHHMLVHFPLAFWALALLMMLLGRFQQGALAQACRSGLPAVLVLAWLGAIAALVSGWLVWPAAANLHSPMVRNHLLMSLWATGLWTVITLLVWRAKHAAARRAGAGTDSAGAAWLGAVCHQRYPGWVSCRCSYPAVTTAGATGLVGLRHLLPAGLEPDVAGGAGCRLCGIGHGHPVT